MQSCIGGDSVGCPPRALFPSFTPGLGSTRSALPMGPAPRRCHVPGGKLGTAYPAPLASCLKRIAGMTPDELFQRYLVPKCYSSHLLNRAKGGSAPPAEPPVQHWACLLGAAARASASWSWKRRHGMRAQGTLTNPTVSTTCHADMIARGFEWTMLNGEPVNKNDFNQPVQPPCCGLSILPGGGGVVCNACWELAPLLGFTPQTGLREWGGSGSVGLCRTLWALLGKRGPLLHVGMCMHHAIECPHAASHSPNCMPSCRRGHPGVDAAAVPDLPGGEADRLHDVGVGAWAWGS